MCPWREVAPELLVPTGLALLAAPVLSLPPSFHRCPPSVAALPPPGDSAYTCLVWPGILCGTRLVCLSAVLLVTTVHTLMMFSVLCMVRDVVCVRSAYACWLCCLAALYTLSFSSVPGVSGRQCVHVCMCLLAVLPANTALSWPSRHLCDQGRCRYIQSMCLLAVFSLRHCSLSHYLLCALCVQGYCMYTCSHACWPSCFVALVTLS